MGIKSIVKKYFPGLLEIRNRIYNDVVHQRFKNKPIEEVFKLIYTENHWNDAESKSGTGSNSEQTAEVKNILVHVVKEFQSTTLLDIPCGDFNWMKDVDLGKCHYYGADIVDELIAGNKEKYSTAFREFFRADLTSSALPKVDLIFCRDCLVHLSYENIRKAVANMKRSGSEYVLTTTFTGHTNRDIVTGNWRPVNLERDPFSFPTPFRMFSEKCSEGGNQYADKSLALWKISDLPS